MSFDALAYRRDAAARHARFYTSPAQATARAEQTDVLRVNPPRPAWLMIVEAVSREHDIPVRSVLGKTNSLRIIAARRHAIGEMAKRTAMSYAEISAKVGVSKAAVAYHVSVYSAQNAAGRSPVFSRASRARLRAETMSPTNERQAATLVALYDILRDGRPHSLREIGRPFANFKAPSDALQARISSLRARLAPFNRTILTRGAYVWLAPLDRSNRSCG